MRYHAYLIALCLLPFASFSAKSELPRPCADCQMPTFTVTVADGWAAFNKNDHYAAYQIWRLLAERGLAEAQVRVGAMYNRGHGVPQDYKEAARWYRKAAEQGDPDGQFELGSRYSHGLGVPKDVKESIKWFSKAGEQGRTFAQEYLGDMYLYGRGVQKTPGLAFYWYKKAAELGDARSQYVLSRLYHSGVGTTQDSAKAREWLQKAAGNRNADAVKLLAGLKNLPPQNQASTQRGDQSNDLPKLLGAFVAGAIIFGQSNDGADKKQQTASSSSSSGSSKGDGYEACWYKAQDQITTCTVTSGLLCGMVSCPPEVTCNRGWSAHRCKTALETPYSDNGRHYCDTENSRNTHKNLKVVIDNICLK